MKALAYGVMTLSFLAFAAPAAAECSWSKEQQVEKPKETADNPSA
mgnify:CR=1 FL=1